MDESEPSDNIDIVAPWAIKAIGKRPRDIATQAARRENLTVGQWLERLILNWQEDGGPAPVQAGQVAPDKLTTDQLIRLGELAIRAKEAGQTGMSDAGQVAGRILSVRLRAGEGLPPRAVSRPPQLANRTRARIAAPASDGLINFGGVMVPPKDTGSRE